MLPFTLTDSPLRIINTVKKFRPSLKQLNPYFIIPSLIITGGGHKSECLFVAFFTEFLFLLLSVF